MPRAKRGIGFFLLRGFRKAMPSFPWHVFYSAGRAVSGRRAGMPRSICHPARPEAVPTHIHDLFQPCQRGSCRFPPRRPLMFHGGNCRFHPAKEGVPITAPCPSVRDVCGDRSTGWQPLTQRRPARWAHWRGHAFLPKPGGTARWQLDQEWQRGRAAVSALARVCLLHTPGAPSHATLHPRRIRDAVPRPPARIAD